jgi:hypothetical protein
VHPYVQDPRVTDRRMRELMTRSERIRRALAEKEDVLRSQPVALRDPEGLVQVVKLDTGPIDRCADERVAS